MQEEGAPLRLKDLALTGKELLDLGIPPHKISAVLDALLSHTAVFPGENNPTRLARLALGFSKTV